MNDQDPIIARYRQAVDDIHPEAKPLPRERRPHLGKLIVEAETLRASRNNWRAVAIFFILAFVLAVVLTLAPRALGADPINDSLRDAAAESIRSVNSAQYLSLYAVPPADRDDVANAVSFVAHHLSHAGVPVTPLRVSPTVLKLDFAIYDPFGVGFHSGREKLTDPRFISDQQHVTVKFANGSTGVCAVVAKKKSGFTVQRGGRVFDVHEKYVVKIEGVAVPPWLDLVAAQGFYDRTGSTHSLVDAREWLFQAAYAPLYHTYRNHPTTVFAWIEQRGLGKSLFTFEKFGTRGWNQDESGVTRAPRGGERKSDGTYVTLDVNKFLPLTEAKDVFAHPDRRCLFDGGEGFGPTFADGQDVFLWDAKGNRIDQADPSIAIDDSWTHVRPLRTGASCWSCHFKKRGGEESGGVPQFGHSDGIPGALDPIKASQLSAYYGYQSRLQRDAIRDREDYTLSIGEVCNGMKPSEAVAVMNKVIDSMTIEPVTPDRACRELGLAVKVTPELTLTEWLAGVSSDVYGELSTGHSISYLRFRNALPIGLAHIAARRHAIGEK